MANKILVMGLPGSGKTTLARKLHQRLGGVHLNGDIVRATLCMDLGFTLADRIEQARRMGWMAQYVKDSGHHAVVDIICPTEATRWAFGADRTIWLNTIKKSRYEDTNQMFVSPVRADLVITSFDYDFEECVRVASE